jgi:hypothetical protein
VEEEGPDAHRRQQAVEQVERRVQLVQDAAARSAALSTTAAGLLGSECARALECAERARRPHRYQPKEEVMIIGMADIEFHHSAM